MANKKEKRALSTAQKEARRIRRVGITTRNKERRRAKHAAKYGDSMERQRGKAVQHKTCFVCGLKMQEQESVHMLIDGIPFCFCKDHTPGRNAGRGISFRNGIRNLDKVSVSIKAHSEDRIEAVKAEAEAQRMLVEEKDAAYRSYMVGEQLRSEQSG